MSIESDLRQSVQLTSLSSRLLRCMILLTKYEKDKLEDLSGYKNLLEDLSRALQNKSDTPQAMRILSNKLASGELVLKKELVESISRVVGVLDHLIEGEQVKSKDLEESLDILSEVIPVIDKVNRDLGKRLYGSPTPRAIAR